MISVAPATVFIVYVISFCALVLGFWLYPIVQEWGRATEKRAKAFYCAKCGHVCIDRGDGRAVSCLQCGHLNPIIN